MKYYFADPARYMKYLKRCFVERYLLSFARNWQALKHCGQHEIMIDSGAYSVWSEGATIDLAEYIKFCKGLPDRYTFVSLDVIPEHGSTSKQIAICVEQSKENYLAMRSELKTVLPAYHFGENIDVLKWYMDQTDYIGIGGMVGLRGKLKDHLLQRVFTITGISTEFKLHGFGFSSFPGWAKYPFFSCDSSTYIRWKMKTKILNNSRVSSFRSSNRFQYMIEKNIKDYLRQEKYITELWKARGISW